VSARKARKPPPPPHPRSVAIVEGPVAGTAILVRPSGERYCRTHPDSTGPLGPLACAWTDHASYTGPADQWEFASLWTTREARTLLPHLAARAPGGRPPKAPQSPDGALVARALATGRYPNREALATALGVNRKALSRACVAVGKRDHYDLPAAARAALEAIVAEGKA